MAEPKGVGSKPTFAGRLRAYTTVAVSTAALIAAGDAIYGRIADSRAVKDAIAEIKIISNRSSDTQQGFILNVGGDIYAENPDGKTIASGVVAALSKAPDDFAILSRSEREFMQAATAEGGWNIEFRAAQMEGRRSRPIIFRCDQPISTDQVIRAFQLYREGDDAWTELCAWRRLPI
jgi:hypothetical protein